MGASIYKNKKPVLVFLIPAFLFMIVYLYYPFFQNIVNSFQQIKILGGKGTGFLDPWYSNYVEMFKDENVRISLINTLIMMLVTLVGQVGIAIILDLYRFIIGLIGSLFFIMLFMKIKLLIPNYKFPILSLFGKYTLGIYLISGYSTILIMRKITDSLSYSIARVFLETIIISFVSLILSIIISKIPYIKKIIGK